MSVTVAAESRCRAHVLLPMDSPIVLLTPTARWTPLRKERLLRAIAEGVVSEAQARSAHAIGEDELAMWRGDLGRSGIAGLRVFQGRSCGRTAADKGTAEARIPLPPSAEIGVVSGA